MVWVKVPVLKKEATTNEAESSRHTTSQRKSFASTPETQYAPRNDNNQESVGLFDDLTRVGPKDAATLLSLVNAEAKGEQDDNKFLLENLVQTLSKLDINSRTSKHLTSGFVNKLWRDLPHPPLMTLGKEYRFRQADGSYNNIRNPNLGAAGQPYARSTRPSVIQDVALPDPGVVFDSLMARGDNFEPHPNGISSVLFYLASIIIHDCFKTDRANPNNNKASSYLDLAPLYGHNQTEQDMMRSFKDGMLKPDCFSDKRLLGMPPGVGVFLIMFNRFHNHVVKQLAAINENGRFTRPKEAAPQSSWQNYDNELFQTARLITCGLYVNIVLKDYVRTILSLNRTDSKWDLDPRAEEGKNLFTAPAEEGVGNQVSAEFNLIYRWHSAISDKDEKWTRNIYQRLFPGRNPDHVTIPELMSALKKMEQTIPEDPHHRPFADLNRDTEGRFDDGSLAEILTASISDVAGSFGANKVPNVMRSVEILGILQARSWKMASLNEFRQFAGLTKHTTFEDINPDPRVAQRLRCLYDHPDRVELYPGLVAEKSKPPMTPGSGLCVNFTTSNAILSDAVALVRGDRFYTLDYTPKNLTNWGFNEVKYDVDIDEGAVMYKLILRAFPTHFKSDSIYAHFPLVVPSENLKIQGSLSRLEQYSWDLPARKDPIPVIRSYEAARKVLDDQDNFKTTYQSMVNFLANTPEDENDFELSFSCTSYSGLSAGSPTDSILPPEWKSEVSEYYSEATQDLLETYGYQIPAAKCRQVDIIRDVANLANTRFAASLLSIPLRSVTNSDGIYTEHELYQLFAQLYQRLHCDYDVIKSCKTRRTSKILAQQLGSYLAKRVERIKSTPVMGGLLGWLHWSKAEGGLAACGTYMIRKWLDQGLSVEEVVWMHMLPMAVEMAAGQAKVLTETLDYYLGKGANHIPELYRLSAEETPQADERLLKYVLESTRFSATTVLVREFQPSDKSIAMATIDDGDETLTVPAHTHLLIDTRSANQDPVAFPDPAEVHLDIPISSYLLPGFETSSSISSIAITAMFKAVFRLKGLRRAKGSAPGGRWYGEDQGRMKIVDVEIEGCGGFKNYMTADQCSFSPLPTTMKLQWEVE